MLRTCLYVLAGVYWLQLSSSSFASDHIAIALVASFALGRCTRPLSLLLLGAVLYQYAVEQQVGNRLDAGLSGESMLVVAQIVDFPQRKGESLSFIARPVDDRRLPGRLRISWQQAPVAPRAGDIWQLELRLKAPSGSFNPGGFDYAGWLFRERIGATGYVVNSSRNHLRASKGGSAVLRLRQRIVDRIMHVIESPERAAVLAALSVGTRHLLSDTQWRRFATTGTSHLMAISGLHIGLAATAAYLLLMALSGLLLRRVNHHRLAALGAALVGLAYASISGLAVPSQRASLMLCLACFALLRRRRPSASHILGLAALLVLCCAPLSALRPGFMLSFAAVASLLWLASRRNPPVQKPLLVTRLWQRSAMLLRLQCLLFMALFGLTALLFGRVSFAAPLVNLILVPVFSLLTVPCVLAGILLDGPLRPAGDTLLRLAAWTVQCSDTLIDKVVAQNWSAANLPFDDSLVLASLLLPALWVCLPRAWPGRGLALLAIAFVCVDRPALPPRSCVDVTVLDVGQGLATVVRGVDYTLIYDTGLAYRGGSSSAQNVILPYLKHLGVRQVNRLIVSHADLDHAGGAVDLLAGIRIDAATTGESVAGLTAESCRAGERWRYGQLTVTTLYPPQGANLRGNAGSCVLLLSVGTHRVLLTGDIEAAAERRLLRGGGLRRVDVVVAPHHGSRTSSSSPFVRALLPALVIVPAGPDNRWGFPHAAVIARWRAVGATVMTTAESGAISIRLCQSGGIVAVRQHKKDKRRPWQHP